MDKIPTPRQSNPRLSEPFWEGARRHQVLVQRCRSCNEPFFYPREHCPSCLSNSVEWVEVSGRGSLYTYTVVRQAAHPGFESSVPYVYAVVQLDEGPRMPSNVVNCTIERLYVGMPLEATFDQISAEWTLVKFKPASEL